MWHLSSYSYSLARLYRFRDPKMEQAYQFDLNKWSFYNSQWNYCVVFIQFSVSCLTYWGSQPLPVDFWLSLGMVGMSIFFFLNGIFNRMCRLHRIFWHFLFFISFMGLLVRLTQVQPQIWTTAAMQQWIPAGHHLILQGPAETVVLDAQFEGFLRTHFGRMENAANIGYTKIIILSLCLNGLNVWTLVAFVIAFTANLSFNCILGQTGVGICYSALQLTGLIFSSVVLSLLLERIQRQKFLAERLLGHQMHVAVTADGILNHMLKNTLADAAGCIEMFLAGSSSSEVLHDSVHCLRRGMKACKQRQVYLKLVAGEYAPVQNAVDLRAFGEDLIAGRVASGEFPDLTVLLDSALLTLVLDNALSNATKHGDPANPDITLVVRPLDDPLVPGCLRIEFLVTNAADPQRPLTPNTIARAFGGDSASGSAPRARVPVLSDGIGLAHSLMAAQVAGYNLSLCQEGDRVVFRVAVDAREATDSFGPACVGAPLTARDLCIHAPPSCLSDRPHLPSRTRVFVLDDTMTSRRILEHQLQVRCPDVCVSVFGATESDVELFTATAVDDADIVILDQHLNYAEPHLGTNVVKHLLLMGYQGMVCIRSGDDSPEDQAHYAACGAHCFLGKDLTGVELVDRLAASFDEFRQKHCPAVLSRLSLTSLTDIEPL